MGGSLSFHPSDRQLVATLARHGELSRDELGRLSGLPRSTVGDALARLRRHGIVAERTVPNPGGRPGRPPKMLALRRHLDVPMWVENDANLAALGEGAFGAAADMTSFIYIKIAHGIGAGLVLERRLHRGTNGLAGELAHIHVDDDGSLCRCGGRGCLMTEFSTPRLIDWIRTVHPDVGSMADVLSLAADRDAGVWRLLRDLGRTIGRSLADFCVYLAPDGIVLDGILQNAGAPVIDGVREMLDQFTPPVIASQVRLAGGVLGDRADLLGAAVLARRHAPPGSGPDDLV